MKRFATERRKVLSDQIEKYSKERVALPGVATAARRSSLVEQMIESLRRIQYVKRLAVVELSASRKDPASPLFDPLRAAVIHQRDGNLDEAIWLVFLATHFGKHLQDGYRLTRDVYLGDAKGPWTFDRMANNPAAFAKWIAAEFTRLKADGINRRFGNHRKYETLRPDSNRGVANVFESYIAWVGANRRHVGLIDAAKEMTGSDPKLLFDYLYASMEHVKSFGRTARFDFLTMIGKLSLVDIEPGIPYLVGATGPLAGARLLFGGSKNSSLNANELDQRVAKLGDFLQLGMQVMEDSLCNWQKSPDRFVAFRG